MGSSSRPTWDTRANAIICLGGGLIGLFALTCGPFVWFRPNRIVEGASASAESAFAGTGWLLLAVWSVTCIAVPLAEIVAPSVWKTLTTFGRSGRRTATAVGVCRGMLVTFVLGLALAEAGKAASDFATGHSPASRTSFGWSFYVFVFAVFLVLYAISASTPSRYARAVIGLVPFVAVAALAASGAVSQLGIIREWELTKNTFAREFLRHLFYALGATIGATLIGIPLGIVSARSRRAETVIMGALNLGQVLPVLAFVGVMIPLLGALSDRLSPLRSLGVSGIGWAPVMVVLFIYALFPIARNTRVAIHQLDPAVLDAARGMGMGHWRSLREVELPLAFPIVLAGVRIALVQSTAGAIIAAFVGGGGLGAIMFMGLEQTSMDLVLVGVVPIVALALFFDALLRAVERLTGRGRRLDLGLSTS